MNRRVSVLVDTQVTGAVKAMESWMKKWEKVLKHVCEEDGDSEGAQAYSIEGPEEAVADLPKGAIILAHSYGTDPTRN